MKKMFFALLATVSFSLAASASTTETSNNELTPLQLELLTKKLEGKQISITNVVVKNNVVCGFSVTITDDSGSYTGWANCTGWGSSGLWAFIQELLQP